MRLPRLFFVCLLFSFAFSTLPLCAQKTQFFPLNEVRPGLKGVGRTIFEGGKIQQFQVELIGVLKNVLAPKHDVILARLSGPVIQETGVAAGMSGSPVYVDGKLLGALAVAFPFSKEPYTLITPIEDMLQVVPESASGDRARVAEAVPWYSAEAQTLHGTVDRWIPAGTWGPRSWAGMAARSPSGGFLSRFRLPMRFSGFDPAVISEYRPLLEELGFDPQEAGVITTAGASDNDQLASNGSDVRPGSMISLMLMRGDFDLDVGCTVTYRQGSDVYACGHQVFELGPTQVPFAEARVLATIPSLNESFKVDVSGPVVGSIRQDRFGAIYGVVGESSPVIPVHVRVTSTLGRTIDYHFEAAQEPILSPLLVNLAVISALRASERMAGPSTLDLKGKIQLEDGEAINLEDVISSNISSAGGVGAAVAAPLSYLLDGQFPKLRIRGIDLAIVSRNESRLATVEQAWSTRSEVRPGDHITVTVVERTPSGGRLSQTIPVDIPANVNSKTLSLVVGSGPAINALELNFLRPGHTPRNLHQLVRELNRTRRNNRVYALLMSPERSFAMDGTDFPSPPPSLLQTFLADPAVSSRITYRTGSVVGDFQTPPLGYTIEGEQTLYLKVLGK